MSLRERFRYWLFPFLKEAEDKSAKVIDELDTLVKEVRREREEVVRRNHLPVGRDNELDAAR